MILSLFTLLTAKFLTVTDAYKTLHHLKLADILIASG